MRFFRTFAVAWSMYSKVPMPQFDWKEKDMEYLFAFFPWVGAAAGGLLYAWELFCRAFAVGGVCRVFVGAALPLFFTGGIHVDGFMDTADAFCSRQPREKKLEILKDPHIGAFSAILLAAYGLVFLGAYSEITELSQARVFCAGFALSRCLGGISVLAFPLAKQEGLAFWFAGRAKKKPVLALLFLQAFLCAAFMVGQSRLAGGAAVAATLATLAWYYFQCRRELGGVTGDTSGYLICVCECAVAATAAVCGKVWP